MKFLWITICIPLLCVLAACSSRSVRTEFTPVYYTDQVKLPILPVNATASLGEATQHLEGRYGEKTFSAEAYVSANDSLFSVYLAGSFGTTIAELYYTKDSISFSSSVLDTKNMSPEYVVADFQLCFAESETLKNHFAQSSLLFTEEKTENGFKRSVKDKDQVVIEVVKENNELTLSNFLRNYSYHISVME